MNIQNEKYTRNSFNFNFCFVFPYNSETISYELTVKRIGEMFKVLEEQNYLLSNLNAKFFIKLEKLNQINLINEIPGFKNFKKINLSSIESLINQIYQDLNNYSECCIPLDSSNSIDIKLFPILPSPLNIKAYQVPILLVSLNSLVDVNWDPTMIKILPYINGINSIKKISELSDSDYLLTKQCIQHLMHYKCLQIIDIFLFGNIYAPTNNVVNFLKIRGLSERCQAYIVNPGPTGPGPTSGPNSGPNSGPTSHNGAGDSISVSPNASLPHAIKVPTKSLLFYLYRSLNQGQTIKQWYIQHKKHLKFIDIRRFINFGILNGLIYRVHSYPILNLIIKSIENNNDEISQLVGNFKSKLSATNINSIIDEKDNVSTTSNDETSNKYLKSIVNESNLKTNRRKISFNYESQRPVDLVASDDEEYEEPKKEMEISKIPNVSADEFNDLLKLVKLLKGFQTMDSVCTEMGKLRGEVEMMLDVLGGNGVINS